MFLECNQWNQEVVRKRRIEDPSIALIKNRWEWVRVDEVQRVNESFQTKTVSVRNWNIEELRLWEDVEVWVSVASVEWKVQREVVEIKGIERVLEEVWKAVIGTRQ